MSREIVTGSSRQVGETDASHQLLSFIRMYHKSIKQLSHEICSSALENQSKVNLYLVMESGTIGVPIVDSFAFAYQVIL